jgi:hypothetical protein
VASSVRWDGTTQAPATVQPLAAFDERAVEQVLAVDVEQVEEERPRAHRR